MGAHMTADEIRAAIVASSSLLQMAHADPPDTHGIAAAVSVGRKRVAQPCMVSARGLAGKLSGGALAAEVILLKLEGARDAMLQSQDPQQRVVGSLLRRQLSFLAGDGLDFGDPALRSMIEQFGAQGLITADEAAHLKALAEVPDPVTEFEVRCAIFADDGSMLV